MLGNLLDIGNSKAHQTIATWAKRHGPIYKFKLAFTNHVVVSDPSEIGPLVARGEELPRPIDLIYQPFNQIGGAKRAPSLVTTKDPALSQEIRRVCGPAFSPDNIRKTFPVIRQAVGSVSDVLAARAAQRAELAMSGTAGQEEEGEEMCDAALRVALDVVGITLFARDFGASKYGDCRILEVLPAVLEEISLRALNPLRAVQHTVLPLSRDALQFSAGLREVHQLWTDLAAEIRTLDVGAAEASGETSIRVLLAKVKNPTTGEPLSHEELAANIATFLVAAFESTGHSVAWTLYDLARHPEVQDKLAAELAGAGLLWERGTPGRDLEYADLAQLTYLDQVWREGLRLHPAGSVVPIKQADRDVVLKNSGLRLPKGTFLWLSIISVHLSPFNYVDPQRFWPERWQQQRKQGQRPEQQQQQAGVTQVAGAAPGAGGSGLRGGDVEGSGNPSEGLAGVSVCPFSGRVRGGATPAGNEDSINRSFIPFSVGANDCIGQGLANAVGRAMLGMLCSRFEFGVAPRMGTEQDVRDAEVIRLTLQPGDGVWLTVRPR